MRHGLAEPIIRRTEGARRIERTGPASRIAKSCRRTDMVRPTGRGRRLVPHARIG
jgi:hypothetical protein